ncbi:hypothetical protein [Gluconobacter wancherniae]|uniref:hypothetical protein n=1 Tax=Gluconobacter wancherniae TaxID=1307955 RepID=UPI001B8C9DAF|nr:hypothetical protein [Gluconobacter wancherniae]MBS1088142.1 hypothetical protein [Gluconobacter wancherniae]
MSYRIPPMGPNSYPGWQQNYIPSPGEWDAWWSNKADASGLVVNGDYLKNLGAALDGVTDDAGVFQAIIDAAKTMTGPSVNWPAVFFDLPACSIFLSKPLVTTGAAVSIRGSGMYVTRFIMKSGGSGIITHGTSGGSAPYPLEIRECSFIDGNSAGSGVAAISAYFNWQKLELWTTWVMHNVMFRNFSQATNACDVARDCLFTNVISEAPDNAMSDLSAFYFTTSSGNGFGAFTGVYIACRTVNHLFGFDFHSSVQLEGQRFYSCGSYSGGGLCRAYLNPDTEGVTNYRSPIWYFHNCDHQGYFFALDLYGCRDVLVDGGFFILNTMGTDISIPASPEGISRSHRSWMSFRSCYAVRLRDVEFDSNGSSGNTTTGVFVDGASNYFRSDGAIVLIGDTIAGFWEWDARTATNVCYEHDTLWGAWPEANNANKILDVSNNQPAESFLVDKACGEVSRNGHYFLRFGFTNLTTDSDGRLTITFPTRPNGKPFLIAGTPVASYSIIKSESAGVPNNWVYSWSSTSIVVQFAGDAGGTTYSGMCLVDGF